MATMRFIHGPSGKRMKMDSSPKVSICKEFGYRTKDFALRNKRREDGLDTYDVFATNSDDKIVEVGILQYKPPLWPGGPSNGL